MSVIFSQSNHVIYRSRDHTALSLLFYQRAQVSKEDNMQVYSTSLGSKAQTIFISFFVFF